MKVLSVNYPKKEEDEAKIEKFTSSYEKACKQQVMDDSKKFNDLPEFKVVGVQRAGFFTQFRELIRRAVKGLTRDPIASKGRFG